ncbi:hypothetical protein ACWD5B_28900 [Streptomyces tanashiensis]
MTATVPVEQPAEEPESSSRAAGGCVLLVALAPAGAAVYAVPELGYTVAGALAVVAVRKARTWASRRREAAETEVDEQEPVDIVAVLQQLGEGGQHVRLTQLQEAAGLPDTKTVRALLDEAGIPIRTGVRAGGKNGPGVHTDDIPREATAPSGGCLCRSDANTNANNDGGEGSEKGFRVERTGQAGVTIYDLSETQHRHHKLTGARRG